LTTCYQGNGQHNGKTTGPFPRHTICVFHKFSLDSVAHDFNAGKYVVAPGRRQAKKSGTFTLNGSAGYFASRIETQARRNDKNRSNRRTSRACWRWRKGSGWNLALFRPDIVRR
jgi:hypothetical protein